MKEIISNANKDYFSEIDIESLEQTKTNQQIRYARKGISINVTD